MCSVNWYSWQRIAYTNHWEGNGWWTHIPKDLCSLCKIIKCLLHIKQCMCVCACSVTRSCPTLYDPMECSLSGISILRFPRQEYWVAISSSWGSSWPRNQTCVSCLAGRFFYHWINSIIDKDNRLTIYLLLKIEISFNWRQVKYTLVQMTKFFKPLYLTCRYMHVWEQVCAYTCKGSVSPQNSQNWTQRPPITTI